MGAVSLSIICVLVALSTATHRRSSDQQTGHKHPDLARIVEETTANNIHFQTTSSFGATYFVDSSNGNNNNDGSMNSPFATLNYARDEIRKLKQNKMFPNGGVLVNIRKGVYMNDVTDPSNWDSPILSLNGVQDSGEVNKPIVYSSYNNENVEIVGGFKIDSKYFHSNGSYLVANLRDVFGTNNIGHLDLGAIKTQSLGLCNNFKSDLYLNSKRMTLARYPNKYEYYDKYTDVNITLFGWTHIADTKNNPNTLIYDTDDIDSKRANAWETEIDAHSNDNNALWIHGYYGPDWADNYVQITGINVHNNELTTSLKTPPVYAYQQGARYYVTNVLSELDVSDEYWIDTANKLVYLSSHASITSNDEVYLSYSPMIFDINNVSLVSIMNVTYSYSTMSGLHVNNSNNVTISNVNGFGHNSYAMEVTGNGNLVFNNTISSIGCVGISMNGGNTYTLERGNNMVLSNDVTLFSDWKRTYNPGIAFGSLVAGGVDSAWGYPSPDRLTPNGYSVGNSLIGNYLGFAPHQCMYGFCNDNVFEYNTFERCVYETTDTGAWYSHFGWLHRGSVIKNNLFIDIYNLQDMPSGVYLQEGVYLDDEASGYFVINNTFVRTRCGVYMGGGRSNVVTNNYFSNNENAVILVPDGLTWEQDACNKGGEFNIELDSVNWQKPPWSTHYGKEFVNIYDEEPCTPIYVNISFNEYCVPSDCLWDDTNCKVFLNPEAVVNINQWGSVEYQNNKENWNNQYCS